MIKYIGKIVTFLVLFLLVSGNVWAQCAMCRGSVESTMGNGRNNVGIGLNTGIMYLFVMPYLIFAVVGYMWYRNSKKNREERQLLEAQLQQAINR
jgi:hypothetical protein